MNKYEKKIHNALKAHEILTAAPKHSLGWVYRKLCKWSKKKRISKKHLQNFCYRLITLTEDSVYD